MKKVQKSFHNGSIADSSKRFQTSRRILAIFVEQNSPPLLSVTGQIFAEREGSSTGSSIKGRKIVESLTKKASRERKFRLPLAAVSRSSFANEFLRIERETSEESRVDNGLTVRDLAFQIR